MPRTAGTSSPAGWHSRTAGKNGPTVSRANRAVAYRIHHDVTRGRRYLTAPGVQTFRPLPGGREEALSHGAGEALYPGALLRIVERVEGLATARRIAWRHEEEGQRIGLTCQARPGPHTRARRAATSATTSASRATR
ncbi:hypothetical protein GCM10022384_02270 [Streptomyces marokkonensis]|uniref:Uncharacterized protein n=1 Tax=Streptomyces marokkonensis TaxID=324855 RepID=A0ABP7NQQ5_9ACTN